VIPWSEAEGSDQHDDERAHRELFERRARQMPAVEVPALADVLRRAEARDVVMPRARVGVGVALAAACFAAVVFGRDGLGAHVVDRRGAVAEVDAGPPSTSGAALASREWRSEDMCSDENATVSDESLACFAPAAPPPPCPAQATAPVCESEDHCSLENN
jgi:hypothetical protein